MLKKCVNPNHDGFGSKLEKSLQSLLFGSSNCSDSREAFHQSVNNTLERSLIYIMSFKS